MMAGIMALRRKQGSLKKQKGNTGGYYRKDRGMGGSKIETLRMKERKMQIFRRGGLHTQCVKVVVSMSFLLCAQSGEQKRADGNDESLEDEIGRAHV